MSDSTPTLDRWQRPDGFPTDAYFDAVVNALLAAGVDVQDWSREEDWEYNLNLGQNSDYILGPLGGYEEVWVSWRCDEFDEPKHADDFTGLGWYWVPYSDASKAGGDRAVKFDALPYLAKPEDVAREVRALVTGSAE